MKNFSDIETLLRESRLPDKDVTHTRIDVWRDILKKRRDARRFGLLFRIRPWMWALASLLLIALCFLFFWVVTGVR